MPQFAKCFNPGCYCYGEWQLAAGGCSDCGAPLHLVVGGKRPPDETLEMPLYLVLFNGPQPLSFPIREAENEDQAAAKAVEELTALGYDPSAFQVERVYGPKDSPRWQGSS